VVDTRKALLGSDRTMLIPTGGALGYRSFR
jgi:hypothetical protein